MLWDLRFREVMFNDGGSNVTYLEELMLITARREHIKFKVLQASYVLVGMKPTQVQRHYSCQHILLNYSVCKVKNELRGRVYLNHSDNTSIKRTGGWCQSFFFGRTVKLPFLNLSFFLIYSPLQCLWHVLQLNRWSQDNPDFSVGRNLCYIDHIIYKLMGALLAAFLKGALNYNFPLSQY